MDGEKAENQDDFLTRMSGIVRLFATICLTQPPPQGLFGSDDAGEGEDEITSLNYKRKPERKHVRFIKVERPWSFRRGGASGGGGTKRC